MNEHKNIIISEQLLAKSVRIGAEKTRINDAEGMQHKQYFRKRMEREGDHSLFWHTRGTIAEAGVLQYLETISDFFTLPQPEWTGGYAWTRLERKKNAGCPDITWLGEEIEVKGMETFSRPIGINRADAEKGRTQILSIVRPLKWQDFEKAGEVWDRQVTLTGCLHLGDFWEDAFGERVWETLPVPSYDTTHGWGCRQVQQTALQDLGVWARQVVERHMSRTSAA